MECDMYAYMIYELSKYFLLFSKIISLFYGDSMFSLFENVHIVHMNCLNCTYLLTDELTTAYCSNALLFCGLKILFFTGKLTVGAYFFPMIELI